MYVYIYIYMALDHFYIRGERAREREGTKEESKRETNRERESERERERKKTRYSIEGARDPSTTWLATTKGCIAPGRADDRDHSAQRPARQDYLSG